MNAPPRGTPVLDGMRVLDFGRYIAGPYCAALLAELGADVVRVEPVGGGDDRGIAPLGPEARAGCSSRPTAASAA